MFHYQKDALGGFNYFVNLNNVGVLHDFQNMNFSGNSLNVVNIVNLLLVENFYRHLLACVNMVALFDLAKSSLTKSLFNFVIAYHLGPLGNFRGVLDGHEDLRVIIRVREITFVFSF